MSLKPVGDLQHYISSNQIHSAHLCYTKVKANEPFQVLRMDFLVCGIYNYGIAYHALDNCVKIA